MVNTFQVSAGKGNLTLKGVVVKTVEGIHIYIGGGDKSHIGTTVISQPRSSLTGDGSIRCTTSIFNFLGHKDDNLALPIAEEVCKYFKEITIVTAGVHINNASAEEIKKLQLNAKKISLLIIQTLRDQTTYKI